MNEHNYLRINRVIHPCRYPVQPELDSIVRRPGRGDEGHPGSEEDERADTERAAAASSAGNGCQALRPHRHDSEQLQG